VYSEIGFIVAALRDSTERHRRAGSTMAVTLHVASMVLSALQLAEVGDGAQEPSTSAVCNCEVRCCCCAVLAPLL
jgi:hypothetical protein